MKDIKGELFITDEMLMWIEKTYINIREGEGSPLISTRQYGGSLVLRFENGNTYKLSIQKWVPEQVTLDDIIK